MCGLCVFVCVVFACVGCVVCCVMRGMIHVVCFNVCVLHHVLAHDRVCVLCWVYVLVMCG